MKKTAKMTEGARRSLYKRDSCIFGQPLIIKDFEDRMKKKGISRYELAKMLGRSNTWITYVFQCKRKLHSTLREEIEICLED